MEKLTALRHFYFESKTILKGQTFFIDSKKSEMLIRRGLAVKNEEHEIVAETKELKVKRTKKSDKK